MDVAGVKEHAAFAVAMARGEHRWQWLEGSIGGNGSRGASVAMAPGEHRWQWLEGLGITGASKTAPGIA